MYVIDTCSLTTLLRVYPRDVFSKAWIHVELLISTKKLVSSMEVLIELEAHEDRLLDWAQEQELINFFIELDNDVQKNAKKILASHSNLLDLRKRKSSADAFIIALAMNLGFTVVTEELPSGGPQKSKIPDVCDAYNIRCINLLQMLRETGLSL